MFKMLQKLIDTQIPLVSLIGWMLGLLALTFTVSSTYGEQKQKLLIIEERQLKIEQAIPRIEAILAAQKESLIRIQVELERHDEITRRVPK